MLFNSIHFLWFFAVVWAAAAATRRWPTARKLLILAASAFFYGYWDARFLVLLGGSTVIDWLCGLGFARTESDRARRGILIVSLVANLGTLAFFKYFGFFVDSAKELLSGFGVGGSWGPTMEVVLPVGISFYTFQTLSYSIDVFRRRIPVERSLLDFALYVGFFPQLVAGPIVRASEFLEQTKRAPMLGWLQQSVGLQLVIWGLFKKCVVADNAAPAVDALFAAESVGVVLRVVAVLAFSMQIYCDFSGYSDIARGLAKMLGYEFPINFERPYFARDPSEFWRRWHITLSTWLRDYLYIPLGGNRGSAPATHRNLMWTMVLGGLWHGAAWNFVLWGVFHGALLVFYRIVSLDRWARTWLGRVVFLSLIAYGWLLFRAESISQIGAWSRPTLDAPLAGLGALSSVSVAALVLAMVGSVVVLVWDVVHERTAPELELPTLRWSVPTQVAVLLVLYVAIGTMGRFGTDEFIYFQF